MKEKLTLILVFLIGFLVGQVFVRPVNAGGGYAWTDRQVEIVIDLLRDIKDNTE